MWSSLRSLVPMVIKRGNGACFGWRSGSGLSEINLMSMISF